MLKKIKFNENLNKSVFIIFLLTLSRIVPHEPNFTPIISFAVMGYIFFHDTFKKIFIVLISMFISDLIIGTHSIMIFVYISIVIISFLSNKKNYIFMLIISPLIFFIISNFGVWILSETYPKNLSGITTCYILAIPFLKNTFVSTIFYGFIILLFSKHLQTIRKKNTSSFT